MSALSDCSISLLFSGLTVAALSWLRLNFLWWPLHPLGFLMATSWGSLNLWFSLFLGWLCKPIMMPHGGFRGHLQFRPPFMGVILGDVLAALLWIIVGFMVTVIWRASCSPPDTVIGWMRGLGLPAAGGRDQAPGLDYERSSQYHSGCRSQIRGAGRAVGPKGGGDRVRP